MQNFRFKIFMTSLAIASAFSSAIASAIEGTRHITMQQDVTHARLIRLNLPAGDVLVTGISGNVITTEVSASCKDGPNEKRLACYELLAKLEWKQKIGNTSTFTLLPTGINNYDHSTLKIKIGVPMDKKLETNLSVGLLTIIDTSGCLTADVNAGEIHIAVSESQLASAKIGANVGDVEMTTAEGERIAGKRSLLVGASLNWKHGTGDCHTEAGVVAGNVSLVLK